MSEVYPATPPGPPPVQAAATPGQAARAAWEAFWAGRAEVSIEAHDAALAAAFDASARAAIDADDYEPGSVVIGPGEHVIADMPAAAPELAAAMAETRAVRDGYARLCGEFGPSAQSGWSARISLTVLNRHRVAAGLIAFARTESDSREDITLRYRRERDEARALVAEMLDHERPSNGLRDEWRARAGLGAP